MTRTVRPRSLLPLFLSALLLAACATPPIWEATEPNDTNICDDADADRCVVLACDEGECAVFDCEDVDPEALTQGPLSHGAELARLPRPPFRAPSTQRNWRRAGLREDARPRMTFHFRYRQGFLPAFPRLEGTLIKHHLFPQAQEFRTWLNRSGINIHEWTMLIPEQVHLRIHRGANGGTWNAAWRQVMRSSPGVVPKEVLIRKAFELALRFDIAGPLRSYYAPVPAPGPQVLAP
ncbi:TIGR02269 family lipoprotein [Archangium violaceum]|uniref:SitA6 family polymorphic toxin lipoprotein n=1 Tax=Archangium violaceum TaxID=83451 RepID=UPI00193B3CAD|nr:TIGR02269 family lipoprotein [Archangium violaceum]QRK09907.1 TIGR02269 family lipoprotein [Archangium violaceum]